MTPNSPKDFREDFHFASSGKRKDTEHPIPFEQRPAPDTHKRRKWLTWVLSGAAGLSLVYAVLYHPLFLSSEQGMESDAYSVVVSETMAKETPVFRHETSTPTVSSQQMQSESSASMESDIVPESSLPDPESFPTQLSYPYFTPEGTLDTIIVFIQQTDGYYSFYHQDGTPFTGAYYAAVGSKSQPELLTVTDIEHHVAGVIAGMYAADGSIYYGVLSLEPLEWVVPCMYEDIYLQNGQYWGDIPMGSNSIINLAVPTIGESSQDNDTPIFEE